MNRMRGTQKQKLSLKKFHRLVRSSFRHSSHTVRKSLLRPRTLLLGLTATIGISSIALAIQQDPHVKSQVIKTTVQSKSSSEAPGKFQNTSTDISVQAPPPAENPSAVNHDANTQVTINSQPVPIENGEIHRTFTNDDGSVFSVDISVNSQSNSSNTSHASTDIDISSSSSSSSSDNSTRGSPDW